MLTESSGLTVDPGPVSYGSYELVAFRAGLDLALNLPALEARAPKPLTATPAAPPRKFLSGDLSAPTAAAAAEPVAEAFADGVGAARGGGGGGMASARPGTYW